MSSVSLFAKHVYKTTLLFFWQNMRQEYCLFLLILSIT